MGRIKRIIAVVVMAITMTVMSGAAALAAPECSPGQHGNPSPGFKPGVCAKK